MTTHASGLQACLRTLWWWGHNARNTASSSAALGKPRPIARCRAKLGSTPARRVRRSNVWRMATQPRHRTRAAKLHAQPTRFAEPESGRWPKARPQRTQHVGHVGRVLSGRKHRRTAKLRLRTRCALLTRHARRVNGPRRRATRRPTRNALSVRMVISVTAPRVLKPKKLRTSVSFTRYARRVNGPAPLAHA